MNEAQTKATLLIIDDEASICYAFQRYFSKRGYEVVTCGDGERGLQQGLALNPKRDMLFLDLRLGDADGLELLEKLRQHQPDLPVVLMTAFGTLNTVNRAMNCQVFEYVTKPLDMAAAEKLVQRALLKQPQAPPSPPETAEGFVGESPTMQELFKLLLRVASMNDVPVLITGATGTGKELAARMIHARSQRSQAPFVAVNCGALPENLVESELFGHCRGTFTGASQDKPGRFEAAHNGVLFLDEIIELPLPAQVKLLRFLDHRQIDRLGSLQPLTVDVRVIAASNRDLRHAVDQGHFRADLYYRLAVLQVKTPRLNEHLEDLPMLARHFLHQLNPQLSLAADACEAFAGHDWPGNVRELRNVIWQAASLCQGTMITASCLRQSLVRHDSSKLEPVDPQYHLRRHVDSLPLQGGNSLKDALSEMQAMLISRALHESGGNRSQAAASLGIHRNVLHRIMTDCGLHAADQPCEKESDHEN